jgi:Rrf2 family protein
MNLNKSTRYALYAVMEMAAEPARSITVAGVAARYHVPAGALAKVLQQLVRAGLALGTRGVGGGYRLARRPSEITVLDVLNVFDPPRAPGRCLLSELPADCDLSHACRLRQLFDEVDEVSRNTFASITLETLAGRRGAGRAEAPASGPSMARGPGRAAR